MNSTDNNFAEMHMLLSLVQNIDVGLIVLDRQYHIKVWNGFMENHSGKNPHEVIGTNLFDSFPEIPEEWLKQKIDTAFLLNNRTFSTWQQRPYMLPFDSYRPITGQSRLMYQDMTIIPLKSINGEIENVGLIIYDVTTTAVDEQALKEANEELDRISRTDGLTRLNNRRSWEEYLLAEFQRFNRSNRPSTLIMLDIDHFKRVNDDYGHQAGDEVIRAIAETITKEKRCTDIAGRYGGEEFGLVLLDTNAEGGLLFAERLRNTIKDSTITYGGDNIRVTISLGIAEISHDFEEHCDWIALADKALYDSKASGRDRATVLEL